MVQDDILDALDNRDGVILVLLDQSAAFDTIDHSILVPGLRLRYGTRGTALTWLRSYLSGRTESIVISGHASQPKNLPCGVPQGSV